MFSMPLLTIFNHFHKASGGLAVALSAKAVHDGPGGDGVIAGFGGGDGVNAGELGRDRVQHGLVADEEEAGRDRKEAQLVAVGHHR